MVKPVTVPLGGARAIYFMTSLISPLLFSIQESILERDRHSAELSRPQNVHNEKIP